ncbi:diguanylate cyclase [Proteobacteria bacterium 005FR1]|nr:diguanylate cyclase [Proteobacteria bacterium 005FR1]
MNPSSRQPSLLSDTATGIPAVPAGISLPDEPGLAKRGGQTSLDRRSVRQLMSLSVNRVNVGASVGEAAQAMQASDSGCLVVVDEGRPVGIVTERDMIRILADILVMCPAEKLCIRDFMSAPPVCIAFHESLRKALALAEAHELNQIPVVDESDQLVGLLSREQLARAQVIALQEERDAIERQVYTCSRELSEANRELQALALQDSLLNIGNRRAMEADIQSTHLNALRYGHGYSVGLIDVDFFKLYNDHYGHCAGDRALVAVADCIRESIRRGDRVYRYGGEELLVLMPETALAEAQEAVNRLACNLYALNIEHAKSPHRRLTISAGVSAFSRTSGAANNGWHSVVEEADAFLYQAKALGRNRVRAPSGSAKMPRSC